MVFATPDTKYHVDKNSWNDLSVKEAWAPPPYDTDPYRPFHVYGSSKVEGERAAWKFMETEKPNFVLNTVNPNFNIGPLLNKNQPASSAGYIRGLWNGNPEQTEMIRTFPPQWVIDVRDCARLHVAGLTFPDVKEERLLGFTEPYSYSAWVEVLKKIDPKKEFPAPMDPEPKDISTVDMDRSVELVKRMGQPGLIGLEESVRELIASV